MKKAVFIINQTAGKNRLKNSFINIIEKFCANGYEVSVNVTLYKKHAEEIAFSVADKEVELIVCCGGDGTLNEVVSGVVKSGKQIKIGYIPSGSTNDFAQSAGIPYSVNAAVEKILSTNTTQFDVGNFNGIYFNYVASFGAFTAVSYKTPKETKNTFGHLAYIFEGMKDLASISPLHAKITTAEGEFFEDDYSFGAIANSKSIGGILHIPNEVVSMNDGKFEILLIKMPKNANQLAAIVHGLTMSDFSSDMFCLVQSEHIVVQSDGSFDWSLDGEYVEGCSKVEISNMHNAVTFAL